MAGLAIVAVIWTATPLGSTAFNSGPGRLDNPNQPAASASPAISAEDFQFVAQLDLRRPLHDPPPMALPAPSPPQAIPALNIHLTGTIVEPDHSQALITMPDGQVELKSVGDDAGGAHIKTIQDGSITVEYFGQSIVLSTPKENGT
jgi:hypothetical protein